MAGLLAAYIADGPLCGRPRPRSLSVCVIAGLKFPAWLGRLFRTCPRNFWRGFTMALGCFYVHTILGNGVMRG